jgi:hypothetical protein
MQAARKAAADTIELAACYSIGLHQLPPCLERFRRDFPTADVRVRYSLTACMTRCWIARSTSAWCVIPGGGPAWP